MNRQSPELQRRLAAMPADDRDAQNRVRRHLSASTAVRSGMQFQEELASTHHIYAIRRWGMIYPHARETVGEHGKLSYKRGGNPVDYTGWVNARAKRIPVVFDAKRMTKGRTYQHNKEQLHQLLTLREADANGAAAFLLVHSVEAERVFMLGWETYGDALLHRTPIALWEKDFAGPRGSECGPVTIPRLPSVRWQNAAGWHWAPLLWDACQLAVAREPIGADWSL